MTRKTTFSTGWSWFKFNNLGLALGMALKLYISVAKGLKRKVLGANSYVCRSYKGKTDRRGFLPPSSPTHPILNGVNSYIFMVSIIFSVLYRKKEHFLKKFHAKNCQSICKFSILNQNYPFWEILPLKIKSLI